MDEKQRLDHKLAEKARRAFRQLNEEWSYDLALEYQIEINSEKMDAAHDALEQCLKGLILRTGKVSGRINEHGLREVFLRLREVDIETADRLNAAYKAALEFYRVKPEVLPEIHGSLEQYFGFAGSRELYNRRKYISEDYRENADSLYHEQRTNLITARLHAELLYACDRVLRGQESAVNVNTRVNEIILGYKIQFTENYVERKSAIENWLTCVNESGSFTEALINERRKGSGGNPIAREICEWLRGEYLAETKDWAIQYVLQRAETILKGSVKTELKAELTKLTEPAHRLLVNSPDGVHLGHIIKLWDGTYQTRSAYNGNSVVVEDEKTAAAFLVHENESMARRRRRGYEHQLHRADSQ